MSVRKAPSAKYSALSSACASTFSQLVMVPCETIKVQLQVSDIINPLIYSKRFLQKEKVF